MNKTVYMSGKSNFTTLAEHLTVETVCVKYYYGIKIVHFSTQEQFYTRYSWATSPLPPPALSLIVILSFIHFISFFIYFFHFLTK